MDCFGQSGCCGEILSGGVECRCQRGAYCRWIVADKGQKECSFELSDWRIWSNGCWKIHHAAWWQNIHTEQFEPRLRRYAQSQLNASFPVGRSNVDNLRSLQGQVGPVMSALGSSIILKNQSQRPHRWRCSAIEFGVEQHIWTMPSAPSALSHVANKGGCDLSADSGSLASAWVSLSKTPENALHHAQGPFQASGGCVQIAICFSNAN